MTGGLAIGIDVGGSRVRAALVDEGGRIVERAIREHSPDVMDTIEGMIGPWLDRAGLVGIGLGVPGILWAGREGVACSANVPGLEGRDLGALGGPDIGVSILNDAEAAALGEMWLGAGRGCQDFVLFTLGTGIGCAAVMRGRLLEAPMEAGHMSIIAWGDKCQCGNYGCLEQYAGARAITDAAIGALEQGAESLLRECCGGRFYRVTAEDVYSAAMEGDALSREIMKNAGRHLGVGIAGVVSLLGPRTVILVGGLTGAWELYVAEARAEARKRFLKGMNQDVNIVIGELGPEDAGVTGAARRVFDGRG